jgi:hypothetical protein
LLALLLFIGYPWRMPSSLETTTGDLGPHLPSLEKCIRGALTDYASQFAKVRHKLTKRSEASIINDLMFKRCEKEFGPLRRNGGRLGVHQSGNRRFVLFKDGAYQIKLKKLDSARKTRNIPTQSVFRFVWQQSQSVFAETPAPTNLHAGYELVDEVSLTTARIWVTCPNGKEVGWEVQLMSAQADAAKKPATVVPLQPEPVRVAGRRARVKAEAIAKRSRASKKAGRNDDGHSGA